MQDLQKSKNNSGMTVLFTDVMARDVSEIVRAAGSSSHDPVREVGEMADIIREESRRVEAELDDKTPDMEAPGDQELEAAKLWLMLEKLKDDEKHLLNCARALACA